MFTIRWAFPMCVVLFAGCTQTASDIDDKLDPADENPLPEWVDDCDEALNDAIDLPAGLESLDGKIYEGIQLCKDDLDFYRIDVPPHTWVSVEVLIDGSGAGGTDLDLFEVKAVEASGTNYLDLVNDVSDTENLVWASATEQPYERLAWANTATIPQTHYLALDGYQGAAANYSIQIQTSEWHDDLDCDTRFEDTSEAGPCNRIMQFPQARSIEDGYIVSHWPHYSNLRREVAYLVRWAAMETSATFEDTLPIALLDMGQRDGDTPGRMQGQLRHPEGTHVHGNDIDIAYYQTGPDNFGRPVCPSNNGYFCTGEATLLDARRTAFFMVRLMESPYLRVIGVDPEVAYDVRDAAQDLKSEGLLSDAELSRLSSRMAYGDGWPFHHHHMHFSWSWESGYSDRSTPPTDGCQDAIHPQISKVRNTLWRSN